MSKDFFFLPQDDIPFFSTKPQLFRPEKNFFELFKVFEKLELSLRKGVYLFGRKRKERKKLPQN